MSAPLSQAWKIVLPRKPFHRLSAQQGEGFPRQKEATQPQKRRFYIQQKHQAWCKHFAPTTHKQPKETTCERAKLLITVLSSKTKWLKDWTLGFRQLLFQRLLHPYWTGQSVRESPALQTWNGFHAKSSPIIRPPAPD